jgi:FlaA1/EpsC-like NDP-sugar epimerase
MDIYEIVQSEGWKKFSEKLELYSSVILVIAILLLLFGESGKNASETMFTISLSTLSVTSFFMGFKKYESELKFLKKYFYQIYGFGIALGIITILFIIQNWPSSKESMAGLSLIFILTSLILGIREKNKGNINNLDWKFFTRIGLTAIPLMIFLLITLIK